MNSSPASPRVHFFNLDFLRCISVFMVVIFHGYIAFCGWIRKPYALTEDGEKFTPFGELVNRFMLNCNLGVDIFFIISGFLITYLLLQEKSLTGRLNVKNFYIRRTLRIWPLYFLVVAIAPFIVNYTSEPKPDYLWTVFFANNFQTIRNLQGDFPFVHFWSVCVEEHFYLVWPLVIALVPVKRLPAVFASLIAACVTFRIYAFYELDNWYMHVMYNTLSRADVIIIGSWIGYRHFANPIQLNISKPVRIILYAVVIFALCIEDNIQLDSLFMICFKKYFYILAFVFAFSNYMFNPGSFLNFKKKNIFHYFGKISYGIYMYHNIFFPIIFKEIMFPRGWAGFKIFFLIYLGIVLAISIVSYELFEKRILKLKDRFAAVKTYH